MPEINIRSGQQPPSRKVSPEQLEQTDYRLRQFFNKEEARARASAGKAQAEASAKEENRWRKEFLGVQMRNARALESDRMRQEKTQYQDALRENKNWDNTKRQNERKAEADKRQKDAALEREERQKRNVMYSEAIRDDRRWEQEKSRDARDMFSSAAYDNRQFEQAKRREARDAALAARAAAANQPIGFLRGAAIGGGAAGVLGAFIGGAPPTRILGAAAGSLAGGIGGALGASQAAAGIYGAIAEAVTKLALEPNVIANSITGKYQDYRLASLSLGRAGLNPGEGSYREFFSGMPGAQNSRLGTVGLGPLDAVQLLSSFGVTPTSNLTSIAAMTQAYGMSSAFTGMRNGTMSSVVGQGMSQGNIYSNGTGLNTYLGGFARILEEATSRGMDRSKLLDSMQQSLEVVAKSGSIGTSPEAIQDIMFRYMNSGMSAGRSGEAAATAVGDITSNMSDITGNKFGSAILMSQLPKFGNLRSAKDFQAFVGPRAWNAAGATPEAEQQRNNAVQLGAQAAQQGRMGLALQYAMEIMKSDPDRLAQVMGPGIGLAAGGNASLMVPLTKQAMGFSTFGGSMGYVLNGSQSPGVGISGGQVSGLLSTGRGSGGGRTGNMMGYDSSISDSTYIARLQAMGMSPTTAAILLQGAKASNTNPLMMAALGNAESGNNPAQGWNQSGTPNLSYGPMQVNLNAHPEMGALTGAGGYAQGGLVFQQALAQNHGNVEAALRSYRGVNDPAWMKKVTEYYAGASNGVSMQGSSNPGFDTGILQSQANGQFQEIQTASMFAPAIGAANALAAAMTNLTGVVQNMSSAFGSGAVQNTKRRSPYAAGPHAGP